MQGTQALGGEQEFLALRPQRVPPAPCMPYHTPVDDWGLVGVEIEHALGGIAQL